MYINIYTKKIIISYLFLWSVSFGLFLISGGESVLNMWWALMLYSVILFLIYALWKFLHGREQVHFFLFFISFLYRVSTSLAIIILLLGSFVLYQNELRPAKFPLYTLSNGEKTLQFQTMSHIAAPSFYLAVREDLAKAKTNGAALFFEGVRPGSEENMEAFNTALGIHFSGTLYENFSRLYGVVAQDNLIFLWLWDSPDINVDMDIDRIMELYRSKKWSLSEAQKTREVLQVEEEIFTLLAQLKPRELAVLQYFNQAILNFFMKQESLQTLILENTWSDIFSVILWERDKYIAKYIQESTHTDIFALYGKLHFDGVYRALQEQDPKWQIQDLSYKQVIEYTLGSEATRWYKTLQNTALREQALRLRYIQSSDSR